MLGVVREIDPPPLPPSDDDLTTLPAALAAFEAFTKLPADGHRSLADHVQQTLFPLHTAYAMLREESSEAHPAA